MARGKNPARISGLIRSRARWPGREPGDLPGGFQMEFSNGSLAALQDGRVLIAVLTPAELADVLGAIPALSLAGDDENIRALMRIIKLLKGEL